MVAGGGGGRGDLRVFYPQMGVNTITVISLGRKQAAALVSLLGNI